MKKLSLLFLCSFVLMSEVFGQTQTIDISTGFDESTNTLIPSGNVDPAWQVMGPGIPTFSTCYSVNDGAWMPNFGNFSNWISPSNVGNPLIDFLPGNYTFRTTFTPSNSAGCSISNITAARIVFKWTDADDELLKIYLNGSLLHDYAFGPGTTVPGIGTTGFPDNSVYTITIPLSSVLSGVNTLDFEVYNWDPDPVEPLLTPIGLHIGANVELDYLSTAPPPSYTYTLNTGICKEPSINVTGTSSDPSVLSHVWVVQQCDVTGTILYGTPTWSPFFPGLPGTYTIPSSVTPCGNYYKVKLATLNPCWAESSQIIFVPCNNRIMLNNVTLVPPGTSGAIPASSLTANTSYTGLVALQSVSATVGMLPAGNYTITNTLTVNAPGMEAQLNNCDMAFDEAAKIDQLSKLTIDKSWLHACERMWVGINSKEYIKVTNSAIEDAYNGILVNAVTSHAGILVDNALFNRNYEGIVLVSSSVNTSSPNNFKITGSVFTCKNYPFPTAYPLGPPYSPTSIYNFPLNTVFTTALPTLGPNKLVNGSFTNMKGSLNPSINIPINIYRSQDGISFTDVSASAGTYLNVGNSSSVSTTNKRYRNYFNALNVGVYNRHSKVYIVNSHFQKIDNPLPNVVFGGVFHENFPGNINTVTNIGDLYNTDKQCAFQNSDLGITGIGGGYLNVSTCDFNNINKVSISVSKWNSPIDIDQNPTGTVDVLDNVFKFSKLDFYAFNNTSIRTVIQGNTSSGNYVPPSYHVNIQEAIPSKYALYRVDGNDFKGKATGVYLNNIVNANVTDNTITIANNNNPTTFTAGIWSDNSTGCLFGNNKIRSQGSTNKSNWQVFGIFTSAGKGNTYCSNDIAQEGISLKFQGNCVPSNVFSNSLDNGLVGLMLDAFGNTGDIGVLSGSTWYAGENSFGNFTISEIRCDNNSNLSPQGTLYYHTTGPYFPSPNLAFGGSGAFLTSLKPQVPDGPLCPTATFRSHEVISQQGYALDIPINDDAMSYIERKGSYYLVKLIEEYEEYKSSDFMNGYSVTNIGKFFNADSLTANYLSSGDVNSFKEAQNLNTLIIPENNVEKNLKEFNTIYYSYLSNQDTISSSEINELQLLAQRCPYTDGGAVYQARALLSRYDNTVYVNECEIRSGGMEQGDESMNFGDISIYPNPTTGDLFVKTNEENVRLEVYSLLGTKIAEYSLVAGENKLNITNLSRGEYILKMYNKENVMIKADKIIRTN